MEIKVYSIPTCNWCVRLKDWLKTNKISFQDFDLTESDSARDEIINKSGQMATPVTIVIKDNGEEKVLVGFNIKELEEALKE